MKRIAAIVLPNLACELVREHDLFTKGSLGSEARGKPFAVIIDDTPSDALEADADVEQDDANTVLDAVDARAWRYGARPGQTAAQAAAFVGRLNVVRLDRALVRRALGHVAEIALGFGTTAALSLDRSKAPCFQDDKGLHRYPMGAGAGPLDTVWLDVTGCSRLVGGEDVLCAELLDRTKQLGYRARVSIANGPRIAQAVARWKVVSNPDNLIVHEAEHATYLADLPIASLPLDQDMMCWLAKLGILRIEDLSRLDRARLAHRLGPRAQDLLGLISGVDDVPLCAHHPPRRIVELSSFEREISGTEPLLFVLRGLTSRAIARLAARGEACTEASIQLRFDQSVIALANSSRNDSEQLSIETKLDLDLPIALSREDELLRALQVKVERLTLPAPITSLQLILAGLTSRKHTQLDITGRRGVDPNALPILLTELSAWVGSSRVGVLSLTDSHRPESQSQLVPVPMQAISTQLAGVPTQGGTRALIQSQPTRILPAPIEVGKLQPGALVAASNMTSSLFIIEQLRLSTRVDRVEWWASSPVCRDYARAWLRNDDELSEAWVFADRTSGRGFLHGWYE